MTEKFYKCTLLTDIVLNNTLATEGNINTLDYIAGSNFLGVVAYEIYQTHKEKAYDLLHSNKVLFGDAHITQNNQLTFATPFSLFNDKNKIKDTNWVHHALDDDKIEAIIKGGSQLKQQRGGYINQKGEKVKGNDKNFVLKSAQDRTNRTSKEGAMFGMSSLKKDSEYIFSIQYQHTAHVQIIEDALLGTKSIGKSKKAQFGRVVIELNGNTDELKTIDNKAFTVVYAQSNLCFFNEYGYPTTQPKASDLGVEGTINWGKSQIRTKKYSSWNYIRNAPNAERLCILKGSVLFVDGTTTNLKINNVGEFHNEGLGKVIYNPEFLDFDEYGVWELNSTEENKNQPVKENEEVKVAIQSKLGNFLNKLKSEKDNELKLSEKIHDWIYTEKIQKSLLGVSPSQWGEIRAKATNENDFEELRKALFVGKDAFLNKGVSAERYWNKNSNRKKFEEIFNDLETSKAVAKYASEMAKISDKNNSQS
jgi:hypothetical protein